MAAPMYLDAAREKLVTRVCTKFDSEETRTSQKSSTKRLPINVVTTLDGA